LGQQNLALPPDGGADSELRELVQCYDPDEAVFMGHLYSFRAAPEEARRHFGYIEQPDFPPRPHVKSAGPIAIVRADKGVRHFALVRWGLIPSWVKVVGPGNPLINARAETVLEKPSFKHAMGRRRCLVPADGFYEFTRKQ